MHGIKSLLRHARFIRRTPLVVPRITSGFLKTVVLRKPVLRSVELAVTYACQAKCEMCYAKGLHGTKQQMTLDQIKDVWRQCRKLGAIHVNITGGEPFLRNDVFDIVRALNPKTTIVSLVTNGEYLTRENVRKLKEAGLNTLQISLDSIHPEEHDKLRGIPGLYDKLMKGVEYAKDEGIVVCLSSVVWHKNFGMFYKIRDLAKELDVFLLLNTPGIVGGWRDRKENLLTREELKECERMRDDGIVREDNMYNFNGRAGCPAGKEKIYVTAFGDVMPCDREQTPYGSALKEPLKDIWKRMRSEPSWACYSRYCKRHVDAEYGENPNGHI